MGKLRYWIVALLLLLSLPLVVQAHETDGAVQLVKVIGKYRVMAITSPIPLAANTQAHLSFLIHDADQFNQGKNVPVKDVTVTVSLHQQHAAATHHDHLEAAWSEQYQAYELDIPLGNVGTYTIEFELQSAQNGQAQGSFDIQVGTQEAQAAAQHSHAESDDDHSHSTTTQTDSHTDEHSHNEAKTDEHGHDVTATEEHGHGSVAPPPSDGTKTMILGGFGMINALVIVAAGFIKYTRNQKSAKNRVRIAAMNRENEE